MSQTERDLFERSEPSALPVLAPSTCSLFRCIVADPPWEYPDGFATQSRSPGKWEDEIENKPLPYPSMTIDAIKALPVAEMADDDCRLWLWTTNRYLPDAFGVMESWGFRYRQTLTWHKSDGNMGGSVAPNSAEFLLVGVKGSPGVVKKWPAAVVKLPQSKKHSKKPEEFRWLIEQSDAGPYLEMFARRKRPGWQTWGNEVPNDVEIIGENAEAMPSEE